MTKSTYKYDPETKKMVAVNSKDRAWFSWEKISPESALMHKDNKITKSFSKWNQEDANTFTDKMQEVFEASMLDNASMMVRWYDKDGDTLTLVKTIFNVAFEKLPGGVGTKAGQAVRSTALGKELYCEVSFFYGDKLYGVRREGPILTDDDVDVSLIPRYLFKMG